MRSTAAKTVGSCLEVREQINIGAIAESRGQLSGFVRAMCGLYIPGGAVALKTCQLLHMRSLGVAACDWVLPTIAACRQSYAEKPHQQSGNL